MNLKNKLILLRIDVNSPIREGKVLDNPRFQVSAETLKELIKQKARIAILAHQGRKGDKDYLPSLEQHAKILARHLKHEVAYIDDIFGKKAMDAIKNIKPKEIILLKNVRSDNNEEQPSNQNNNYKELCALFDIYINDAFSVSHRAQGSLILPPKYLPSELSKNCKKELTSALSLKKHLTNSKALIILAGSKVEDYLELLTLLKNPKVSFVIAGALGDLILEAKGINLGFETSYLKKQSYYSLKNKILSIYNKHKEQILLPKGLAFKINNKRVEKPLSQAPFDSKVLDIGKETTREIIKQINSSNTIFMKGPLGFAEIPGFQTSTIAVLKAISKKNCLSVLSGGHLSTAIQEYKIPSSSFTHISLAGGAFLSALLGKSMPGIDAIKSKKR